ncbi:MAG: acyltransferase family protein [Ruminococcus sp.]|nr:acyltransferase family protein [Ruminococcus sp.]
MKKRITELDFIKGLAIILVCIGHAVSQIPGTGPDVYEENSVFRFIYSFHMPLFTFISGYICRLTLRTDAQWLKKRLRQIAVPYLLALVLWYVILGRSSITSFLSPMAYWYLPFILIADTVLFLENKYRLRGLLFAGVIGISVIVCKFERSQIDIAHHLSHCLIFYAAGTAAPELKKRHGDKLLPIYCILSAGFAVLTPLYGQGMERQMSRLEKIFGSFPHIRLLTALIFITNKFIVPACGIGAILLITYAVYHVQQTKLLRAAAETVGRHTLFIYVLHDLFLRKIADDLLLSYIISVPTAIIVPMLLSIAFNRLKAHRCDTK